MFGLLPSLDLEIDSVCVERRRRRFFETRGVGSVLSSGWELHNNTIHGQKQVSKLIAPTPAVGGIFYDDDEAGATVTLVPRAPYGQGTLPAIESIFFTTDGSWPQIGVSGTTVRASSYTPNGNILANATIRITRTCALNVRYRFVGTERSGGPAQLMDSMTMTLIVPVPPQKVRTDRFNEAC